VIARGTPTNYWAITIAGNGTEPAGGAVAVSGSDHTQNVTVV
jgi:hypothetical protein